MNNWFAQTVHSYRTTTAVRKSVLLTQVAEQAEESSEELKKEIVALVKGDNLICYRYSW